ncbi:MAG: AMP-binding protein [Nitrospirae bacterium]|nr:AMP-binding protein [Nitrospirota bacterium]
MSDTLFDRFSKAARRLGHKNAFNFFKDDRWHSLTYEEFYRKTLRLARLLSNMGVGRTDNAAICSENMPQWCASYLAIIAVGAVAVPIDAELGALEIVNILKSCAPRLVLCSAGVYPKLVVGEHAAVMRFDSEEFLSVWETETATVRSTVLENIYRAEPQDVASIIYTSGTTGQPKGVMLTHGNFCADADAVLSSNLLNENDNVLSALPLHHTYPFMGTFIVPITCGGTVTYPIGLKGADLARSIKEQEVTVLVAVPRLLEMLLKGIENKIGAKPLPLRMLTGKMADISSKLRLKRDINIGKSLFKTIHEQFGPQFRFIACGGARLAPEVMTALEAYGFTVLEGYGLTETSPVVTFNPLNRRKAGSAGIPLPGVEIMIAAKPAQDEQPRQSPSIFYSKEGEILIRGGMVFIGYYGSEEETAKVFTNGWFHTGDVGYLDEDGYLFITGREKDVIVLGSGKNVYPEDVERKYAAIPIVKEICVISKDTKTLHAIIVPDIDAAKEMQIVSINEFLRWEINKVSLELPSYMRLSGFTLYSEPLPKTRLGKLRRFIVKDIVYAKKRSSTPQESEITDPLSLQVTEVVKRIGELEDPPSIGDNIELDLGFDSLRRLELIAALENQFQIKVPDDVAVDLHTVEELIEGVRRCIYNVSGLSAPTQGVIRSISFKDVLSKEPSEEDINNLCLEDRITPVAATVLRSLRLFLRTFYSAKLKGLENLISPPYILCPNHVSFLDAFIVAGMLPLRVFENLYFQGAQDYFETPVGKKFAKISHTIPINPDLQLTRALTLSAYLLRKRYSLCIFPEGGRSLDGRLSQFKKGVGTLAIECNVPLVPLYIDGAYEALPRGAYMLRKSKITVTVGTPLYPADFIQATSPGKENYQLIVDALRDRMETMAS